MRCETEELGKYVEVLSGFAFKSKDFSESGIPVIKIKNINPPEVSLHDVSYVPGSFLETHSKYVLDRNDILIAMTGSHINQWASVVGRVARVRYKEKTFLNQRVGKIIVTDTEKCDENFVYYYLSQDSVKIELANIAGGAANQANISPADIKGLRIPFPGIDIQRRIGEILSAHDDLIEDNKKQIKLLEEMAQRLYKEWFVDLHFPGYEDVEIVDGVPEGWRNTQLDTLGEFRRGKTITRADIVNGGIAVVAGGREPAYYHNVSNTEAPVITISASGVNAGFVRMYYKRVWASDCSYVDKNHTNHIYYLYCFLKDNKVRIDNLQKGVAQPHVYAKDINALEMLVPSSNLLTCFDSAVEPIFAKIGSCNEIIERNIQMRDKLLPYLMTGKLEV